MVLALLHGPAGLMLGTAIASHSRCSALLAPCAPASALPCHPSPCPQRPV